jgi:hypothetical protein
MMDVSPDNLDAWLAAQAAAEAKRAKAAGHPVPVTAIADAGTTPGTRRRGAAMTRAMLLSELLPELEGLSADLAVTGLVMDSREVQPGDAFVAIAGFGAHGLNFVGAGARSRCGRDPVRTAGARGLAGTRRCDPGARPALAHGRDGRPASTTIPARR